MPLPHGMSGKQTLKTITTMRQKITWMHFLILGLIISLAAILSSCDKDVYGVVTEHHFINQTNHHITYPIGYEKFNVSPQSTTTIRTNTRVGGKVVETEFHSSPLFILPSSSILTIKFDNSKCLIDVKVDDVHSVRNIKDFSIEKVSENRYKFTYTFTEADYNRAVTCP